MKNKETQKGIKTDAIGLLSGIHFILLKTLPPRTIVVSEDIYLSLINIAKSDKEKQELVKIKKTVKDFQDYLKKKTT